MEMTTLGDLINLQRGYDLTETQRRPGSVPIVGSAGVHGYHDTAKAKGPGITLGRSGASFGRVTFIREDFWPHNTTIFVTDFKGNEPLFIRYLLESLDFSSLNSGSAQQSLNRNFVYPVPVMRFALPLQRRIAGILSAYDELMENSQRRIRILEEMARALYREWFVHFRFPGHEKLPRVASPLGDVPQGWRVKKLVELTAFLNRGLSPSYDENGASVVINQKCIRDQRLSLDPARRQSKAIPPEKLVRFGDVLINSTGVGTLGRVAQVYQDVGHCSVDTHVTIARANHDADVDFFGCALLEQQETFDRLGVGATGQTELSRTSIANVELAIPPIGIQRRFGELVRPMRSAAITLVNQIQNLRRTRDLLLPRLLSGQQPLKPLDP